MFKPEIKHNINNNKTVFYSFLKEKELVLNEESKTNELPFDTLDRLLSKNKFIFSIPVTIKTNDKVYDTKIAGKIGSRIVTTDKDSILISDIISIEEK